MFFPHSIQRCITATLVLLILPIAIAAAALMISASRDVVDASRAIPLAKTDKLLLLLAADLRGQRGDLQTVLVANEDPRAQIAKGRDDLAAQFGAAIQALRETDLPRREELAKGMADSWAAAAPRYADLMAEAAKPRSERRVSASAPWFAAMEKPLNAVLAASTDSGHSIRRIDTTMAELQDYKQNGWSLRANYGGQCSLLGPSFGSGAALDPALSRRLGEMRGKAAANVFDLADAVNAGGRVSAALKANALAANKAVVEATTRADGLLAKLGSGPAPVDATEWRRLCVEPYDKIMAVVTTSLDEVVANASRAYSTALMKLSGAALATLIVIGLGAASWRNLRNRVTAPVLDISATLERLQSGDLAQPVAVARYPDEIGALSNALETYRQNAMALEQARREREDAQADELREAASRQMVVANVARVVAAARAGDFSGRIQTAQTSGAVNELADGVNAINIVVDETTTELADVLRAIADGDLSRTITSRHDGRFGELRVAVNETIARLSQTVSTIQSMAREVASASSEISTSTTDLSQRTEEQAASLEETSAAMEEIASIVAKNAGNARSATQSANDARDVASRGGSVVSDAVDAMARIEESSRRISDIIGVIDEIARQTNLLALNAAVEAARAGEAGRGFAVVAAEVRSLAQRSSQAAKDITALITSSNGQVKDGVELVNRTGASLQGIAEAINAVAGIVADIASASAEQATGVAEVNKALSQMDSATQQNSAMVEENAATSKTLEQQAEAMREAMSFFHIGGGNRTAEPRGATIAKNVVSYARPIARGRSGAAVARRDEEWTEF